MTPSPVTGPPLHPQSVPTEELRNNCLDPPHTRMIAVVEGPTPPSNDTCIMEARNDSL